jgi:predicted O-methyltransferase YrrM
LYASLREATTAPEAVRDLGEQLANLTELAGTEYVQIFSGPASRAPTVVRVLELSKPKPGANALFAITGLGKDDVSPGFSWSRTAYGGCIYCYLPWKSGSASSVIDVSFLRGLPADTNVGLRIGAWGRPDEPFYVGWSANEDSDDDKTDTLVRLSADVRQVSADLKATRAAWNREVRGLRNEIEAFHQLYGVIGSRSVMPPTGGMAMNAVGLVRLLEVIRCQDIETVAELGSGTSTVWLAEKLASRGGRVISFDHLALYADRTTDMLQQRNLTSVAEVRLAPLKPVVVGGEAFLWYDADTVTTVGPVDLLFVDGPPAKTGPLARYPALPLMLSCVRPGGWIVLDDVVRADELEIADRWLGEYGDRVALVSQDDGIAVFRVNSD